MRLIATYRNPGYDALAEAALGFYERREDLRRPGVAFGHDPAQPAKVSTDISLVAIDRSDPEAHGLAELIVRGVSAGLDRYLKERPLLLEVCPERSLFVNPIFNLQRYAPGEGFRSWHCDWTISEEDTEPIRRVLAWILYLNTLPDGGTEFHWQDHHEEAERGKLLIFPASPSHTHRGRVSQEHTKTIATGWINAGTLEAYIQRLAAKPVAGST
ncbi:2OG-Fe(II) oxygenase [Synechococcus sp. J7-Johnson]|uniref:2OG-Fe(II) oxygenase n=1 Tax=Synechococcus sp. J7-Johnson TaxID=2823737 RepID=UPI0020CBB4BC|nr:2OG-Fe(II) oxygenase [Synechococcus sp. J7-Johnson]MCP9840819.1 2OG-Fe(II) oxygenase [Synechococcus sp. J7-Johnson]